MMSLPVDPAPLSVDTESLPVLTNSLPVLPVESLPVLLVSAPDEEPTDMCNKESDSVSHDNHVTVKDTTTSETFSVENKVESSSSLTKNGSRESVISEGGVNSDSCEGGGASDDSCEENGVDEGEKEGKGDVDNDNHIPLACK